MHYETHIDIDAPPATVWALLTNPTAWPELGTGVHQVTGTVALGNKLTISGEPTPDRTFKLKVSALDDGRRMQWSGGMPLGLFRGVRSYTLDPSGSGTRFTMREEFSGPMAGMITKSMPDLQPSFDKFVSAIKAAAERNPHLTGDNA